MMFMNAKSFDANISQWNVSTVTNMDQMFFNAESFKQRLCGAAWVSSEAANDRMFQGSYGSISSTMCSASWDSWPQRWLARWRKASTPRVASGIMMCPNCGTFKRSGRVSCCAPGGAWYKNCGDAGSRKSDHSWFEGVEACKCKSRVDGCRCN